MAEPKKIFRSKKDKIIAGVCGGIAEYFNVDPVWIRLIAILLIFAEGIGVVLYIIAWILIPENPSQTGRKTVAEETVEKAMKGKKKDQATTVLGVIIIVIGGGLLFQNLFSWFSFNLVWPLGIIAIGVYLLVRNSK